MPEPVIRIDRKVQDINSLGYMSVAKLYNRQITINGMGVEAIRVERCGQDPTIRYQTRSMPMPSADVPCDNAAEFVSAIYKHMNN